MATLIVAFSKIEEAKAICGLLQRRGYQVAPPCVTGNQVINLAESLCDGIIISGYKLADEMLYSQINEYKPSSFELLLVASKERLPDCMDNDIVCASLPLKANELVSTVEMMLQSKIHRERLGKKRPRRRSESENELVRQAKVILMEKNNMTEPEAHRYIQKNSMDSGNDMAETALMVISIFSGEG